MRKRIKYIFVFAAIFCFMAIDIVTSRIKAGNDPSVDSFFYESGSALVDGYTAASIKTHVALVNSQHTGLSSPKALTQTLSTAEIREMVYTVIDLDKHWGTSIPELKYTIDALGAGCWVTLLPNLVSYPGRNYMVGDQTDPRIIQALLDYIADSTSAERISLLAGGSYGSFSAANDIFTLSDFSGVGWNSNFLDLPTGYALQSMVTAAQARHTAKTIECLNLNYNEILDDGRPYNEIPPAELAGCVPQIYPVPDNNPNAIGALTTANIAADGGYNITDAVKNCDVLVNIPVMKTTGGIIINCVHKNYIGTVSRGVYALNGTETYPRDRGASLELLDHTELVNTVSNLFSYHPGNYTLVDALASLEGEGSHPSGSKTGWLRRNFLLAGGDPVAVEAVACQTMKLNPLDMDIIRWSIARGLGTGFPDQIAIVGDSLGAVQTDVLAPIGRTGTTYTTFNGMHYLGRACRRWLLNGPYTAADNTTQHINEAAVNPFANDLEGGNAWTGFYATQDFVDLTAAVAGTGANSVVYAFTKIYSETAQTGFVYAGGVRDLRIYVNGQMIVDTTALLTYNRVTCVKGVTLNQGDNRILVKVRRSGSEYGFSCAIVNDGSTATRSTYVPYTYPYSVSNPFQAARTLTDEMKRSYFGGRTLEGSFYHLGANGAPAVEFVVDGAADLHISCNPNPFNPTIKIAVNMQRAAGSGNVYIDIYNAHGKLVKNLPAANGSASGRPAGITWDATGQPSGVYIVRATAGGRSVSRRICLVK
ncbi:MAG: hypothetical protein A2268_06655 [Candidatus Raymondbacteria bacterium RifOxyA12_full_50_37]|nr:MAG: hypothetical protein A2268_06655 [Candidatus Raymondbacteria bacterium RifOxyA12_full_50_37]OGJ88747.1 MAG: hypothetical protein A2248_07795 [Candidatus Raymondbacteria bacterium RIFOXYA2_FULL_49_16]OGK01277.1 MAG: hypothetical protein A2487_09795 [Candidatus Raymondbacteria bacterium RifOxyC12_full_50_8]OGP42122.1 MAG: hypothetical protein A2324_14925 [Candidatus Raymondbacteria bacterium RIFOXYB2_FULL_49_35]